MYPGRLWSESESWGGGEGEGEGKMDKCSLSPPPPSPSLGSTHQLLALCNMKVSLCVMTAIVIHPTHLDRVILCAQVGAIVGVVVQLLTRLDGGEAVFGTQVIDGSGGQAADVRVDLEQHAEGLTEVRTGGQVKGPHSLGDVHDAQALGVKLVVAVQPRIEIVHQGLLSVHPVEVAPGVLELGRMDELGLTGHIFSHVVDFHLRAVLLHDIEEPGAVEHVLDPIVTHRLVVPVERIVGPVHVLGQHNVPARNDGKIDKVEDTCPHVGNAAARVHQVQNQVPPPVCPLAHPRELAAVKPAAYLSLEPRMFKLLFIIPVRR